MLEVESQNHKACLMLTQLGFKGGAFKRCVKRRVDNLSARVSTMSSEEEQVIALAKSGFNLSSMFFTVSPSCLSTDAIFKAIEQKRQQEEWKERVKKRKGILEEKTAQDKGREAAAKERKNKGDYERMLRWKMVTEKYKADARGKKIDILKALWGEYNDIDGISIVVPDDEEEPRVPTIQDTTLGDASADLLKGAAKPWIDNSRCARLEKLHNMIDDKLKERDNSSSNVN
jgi:hypothetical protein